jgi:hypothetical protein
LVRALARHARGHWFESSVAHDQKGAMTAPFLLKNSTVRESMVEIKPVTTKKQKRDFVMFPYRFYRKMYSFPNWVPPLIMDEKKIFNQKKDPFYLHADASHFLAYKDGRVIGRIAGIIDHNFVKFHGEQTAFFGYFECREDQEAAVKLVEAAESWGYEMGMEKMIGPMNPSTNHILGVQITNFETPPVIQMPYNPPFYDALLKGAGFEKEKDLYSYIMNTSLPLSDKIKRVTEMVKKRSKINLRRINLKEFDTLSEMIREIWNDAWSSNWGFVPWTKEEFNHLAKDLKLTLIPELVLLAETQEGEPIGFAFPIPDLNQIFIKMKGRLLPFGIFKLLAGKNKIPMVRIAAFGVKKKYQNTGLDALFIHELYTRGVKLGINSADFSWILEDNMNLRNLLEGWGTTHYKTHRIYGKKLQQPKEEKHA